MFVNGGATFEIVVSRRPWITLAIRIPATPRNCQSERGAKVIAIPITDSNRVSRTENKPPIPFTFSIR